jgi:hypothetical protein
MSSNLKNFVNHPAPNIKIVIYKMSTRPKSQNPNDAFQHIALDYREFVNRVNRFNERFQCNVSMYLERSEAVTARMDRLSVGIIILGVQNQILRQHAEQLRHLLEAKEGN